MPVMRSLVSLILLLLLAPLSMSAESAEELLAAGRVDSAIAVLEGKIKSDPNDAASYNLLCRSYFTLASWDRGVADCEKAVALEPSNSRYHLWLGRIYGEKADNSNFFAAAGLARQGTH